LMNFLTKTGMNFLDLIDLQEFDFYELTPLYNFISKNSVSSIDVSRPQQ